MNLKKRIAIFSLEPKALEIPKIAEIDLDTLRRKGVDIHPVTGCYKGKVENSFACYVEDDAKLNLVVTLAYVWSQESILVIEENDRVKLLYPTLHGYDETRLGEWKSVSEAEALKCDAWTKDASGQYFIVR